MVSRGSTAQGSGPTLPELLPTGSMAEAPEPRATEGRKLAEELKLRKSPLEAPQGPKDGHNGGSRGHGAEDA